MLPADRRKVLEVARGGQPGVVVVLNAKGYNPLTYVPSISDAELMLAQWAIVHLPRNPLL